MKLVFEGKLQYKYDEPIMVGKRNVINEINSAEWENPITFAILSRDALYAVRGGDIYGFEGFPGYSEITPGESTTIEVGSHYMTLSEYNREEVVVIVSDEPVDLGEIFG